MKAKMELMGSKLDSSSKERDGSELDKLYHSERIFMQRLSYANKYKSLHENPPCKILILSLIDFEKLSYYNWIYLNDWIDSILEKAA